MILFPFMVKIRTFFQLPEYKCYIKFCRVTVPKNMQISFKKDANYLYFGRSYDIISFYGQNNKDIQLPEYKYNIKFCR